MPQLTLLDQLADQAAPDNGVLESIVAARSIDAAPGLKVSHYLAILRAIYRSPWITDEQGQDETGIPGNTYRPRRGELADAGLLCHAPGGRTRSGRAARRWALTPIGRAALGIPDDSLNTQQHKEQST